MELCLKKSPNCVEANVSGSVLFLQYQPQKRSVVLMFSEHFSMPDMNTIHFSVSESRLFIGPSLQWAVSITISRLKPCSRPSSGFLLSRTKNKSMFYWKKENFGSWLLNSHLTALLICWRVLFSCVSMRHEMKGHVLFTAHLPLIQR